MNVFIVWVKGSFAGKKEIVEQNHFFLIVEMCTNNVVESKIYR
jgi:hypothetical protein